MTKNTLSLSKRFIAILTFTGLASAQLPDIIAIGPAESLGGGRIPAIAVDQLGQPHVVADGGSNVFLYDKIGGQWQSQVVDVRPFTNSPQFYNPHIEIDPQDRAWVSGVTWVPSGGVGVFVRENISTNPSGVNQIIRSRAGASFPVGLISTDPDLPNQAVAMGTNGGWQRINYSGGSLSLGQTGVLPIGNGGEKTAFDISKAGPVTHPNGSVQAVWHGAMGGFSQDHSAYINSIMHARGQGRIVWASHGSYPSMSDDGSYVKVLGDAVEPEVAYITCDFTAGGARAGAGIGMNIFNGSSMNFPPNNILILDSAGTAGIRRFAPQMAAAPNGGVYVVWTRGGRVRMRFVPADATSINDCSPEWDLGPGGPSAIATDENGNVHLATNRSGTIHYRMIEMTGGASAGRSNTFAVDFTGDGRDDPAVFNDRLGTLTLFPGLVGFGERIDLPFVSPGDIPVFANYNNARPNRVEVGVFRPSEGNWYIYKGDIFQPYDSNLLESINWGTGGDIPFAGDLNGNGFAEIGVFRPEEAKWFIRKGISEAPTYTGSSEFTFGAKEGIPLVGRWRPGNRDNIVIWNPDTSIFAMWGEDTFVNGHSSIQYGAPGMDIPVPADYDGDGILDIAVFRTTTGQWFSFASGGSGESSWEWGAPGDVPVPGRYTYDNRADVAILRNSLLYIAPSEPGQPAPFGRAPFLYGSSNHIPIPADYDGDGKANIAAFERSTSTWNIHPHPPFTFGAFGDLPVAADYDGDGIIDFAVFRPTTAEWFIYGSATGFQHVVYGAPGDTPIPADYDGDGFVDLGVYRNGSWFTFASTAGPMSVDFGTADWQPIPSTYTTGVGGAAQLGIFHSPTATWQIPGRPHFSWGPGGGIAVPADYSGNGEINLGVYENGWWWILLEDDQMMHGPGPVEMPSGSLIGTRNIRP